MVYLHEHFAVKELLVISVDVIQQDFPKPIQQEFIITTGYFYTVGVTILKQFTLIRYYCHS